MRVCRAPGGRHAPRVPPRCGVLTARSEVCALPYILLLVLLHFTTGVVWCEMVWCEVVCCGVVQCMYTTQHNIMQRNTTTQRKQHNPWCCSELLLRVGGVRYSWWFRMAGEWMGVALVGGMALRTLASSFSCLHLLLGSQSGSSRHSSWTVQGHVRWFRRHPKK